MAVAVSAADVLDPDSDLRQVAGAASETDVLVARVDRPATTRVPFASDAPDYDAEDRADDDTGLQGGFTVPLPAPAHLHLHHLGLRWQVGEADEQDLVAALSELIGFDPDDEVFCVAPATGPDVADLEQTAVERAVRRVARVYGLPVLRYRRTPEGAGIGMAEPAV